MDSLGRSALDRRILTDGQMTLLAENAYNARVFFRGYPLRGSVLMTVDTPTPNSFLSLEIQKP